MDRRQDGDGLKIRQGIKFHDGSELTAEDVAFSMNRLKEVSIYKATYARVKEYQVRDKATLQLVFERFDPSFPRWLGFLAGFVVPKAYFKSLGADDKARSEEFARKPVGSGPYKVVAFTPGSTLVLEAFDGYWKGAPPIKRAVFKMVTDPTARVAEIVSGTRTSRPRCPVEEFGRLSTQPTLKGVQQPVADMAQIFLKPRFAPFQEGGGAAGRPLRDRQEGDRRQGAAGVRSAALARPRRPSTMPTTAR